MKKFFNGVAYLPLQIRRQSHENIVRFNRMSVFALETSRSEGTVLSWGYFVRRHFGLCSCELCLSSLQGQCTVMSLTWPSSKCRRTIVWRSSKGSGGMVASVQRRRTTVLKVCLQLILICLFFSFNLACQIICL